MQEIQFLEFMGGSNLPQAFPNYFICLRFIRISRVHTLSAEHSSLLHWSWSKLVDSILMISSYTCSSHRSVLSRCTDKSSTTLIQHTTSTSNHNNIVLKILWLLLLRAPRR